jgi:hypothetical protein
MIPHSSKMEAETLTDGIRGRQSAPLLESSLRIARMRVSGMRVVGRLWVIGDGRFAAAGPRSGEAWLRAYTYEG